MGNPKGLSVSEVENSLVAILYHTRIVEKIGERLILRSGGWFTNHTKKCINLVLNRYVSQVIEVRQIKGEWFVLIQGQKVPFQDGMTIDLSIKLRLVA
jgi:hypothetical protein